VFDPAASPHYEVFLIPRAPGKKAVLKSLATQSLTDSAKLPNIESGEVHFFKDRPSSEQYNQKVDISTSFGSHPTEARDEQEDPHDLMEWPPSSWAINVFSSTTRQWHMRSFLREGEAAGTISDAQQDQLEPTPECWGKWGGPTRRYGVCWQGSLYVHCHGVFVARYTLWHIFVKVTFSVPPECFYSYYITIAFIFITFFSLMN
jgi:hypothetical protein